MKLFFLMNDKPGGAEQVFKEVVLYHLNRKDDVLVCFLFKRSSSYWDSYSECENFKSIYLKSNLGSLLKYRQWFNKNDFHVFSTHVYITGVIGILMAIKLFKRKPFVARESTSIFKRHKGFKLFTYLLCYKLGYPSVDLLICQTNLMKNELLKALPRLEQKVNIQVIANPFNPDNALISPSDVNLQSYGEFIVAAGRLIPEKGFDLLIEAFAEVKKVEGHLKLIILGEGPERERLTHIVNELGLLGEVVMLGFVTNVYQYFRAAKVCVVSSRLEGFPNVLLQMMSQNERVVSTKCAGGIDEIPGLLMSEIDVLSLSKALTTSLKSIGNSNRTLFNNFLNLRSVESFVHTINSNLDR